MGRRSGQYRGISKLLLRWSDQVFGTPQALPDVSDQRALDWCCLRSQAPREDSDFEYFIEATEGKVKCKHCELFIFGADATDMEAHRKTCPEKLG